MVRKAFASTKLKKHMKPDVEMEDVFTPTQSPVKPAEGSTRILRSSSVKIDSRVTEKIESSGKHG